MIAVVISTAGVAAFIQTTGHYWLINSMFPLLVSVGSGLMFTVTVDTPNRIVIGYQIILGAGVGGGLQNMYLAVQAEYSQKQELIPQSTSLIQFFQWIGAAISIALAGLIFANRLHTHVAQLGLTPDVEAAVRESVDVIFTLPMDQRAAVIQAYIASLDYVFLLGVPAGIFGAMSAASMRSYNLKKTAMSSFGASA